MPTSIPADADALVAGLLELPEARGLALEALLRLSSIEWDTDVATACVECTAHPRLLLNPTFVVERCDTRRKLAFLVLHELAHVSLGHTGLAPRATLAQNVAFDAIINATLLQGFVTYQGEALGWDALVVAEYAADESPWFLLRPPPDWHGTPDWEASRGAPEALRAIHRRLYDRAPFPDVRPEAEQRRARWEHVTYGEILSALRADGFGESMVDAEGAATDVGRLLGGHGATDRERAAHAGGRDARVVDALSEVLSDLPGARHLTGGGDGALHELRVARVEPDARLVAALRRVLRGALLDERSVARPRRDATSVVSVDPTRDRRAAVRRHVARALGAPAPLLFQGESTRVRPVPDGRTAIYLDVSGSMDGVLEALHASLLPLRRLLAPRVFEFSTEVAELTRTEFERGRIRTTGGTDADPVLAHLASEARAGRIRRAVLLTDGVFGDPSPGVVADFKRSGAELHLGLIGQPGRWSVTSHAGAPWVASETRLPALRETPESDPFDLYDPLAAHR